MMKMSTNAIIGVKNANGTITSILVHHDGYPRVTGAKLRKYFPTAELAAALVAKGDIRWVGECLSTSESYKEMRNEDRPPTTYPNIQKWLDDIPHYGYVFDLTPELGKWSGYDSNGEEMVIPPEYHEPPKPSSIEIESA